MRTARCGEVPTRASTANTIRPSPRPKPPAMESAPGFVPSPSSRPAARQARAATTITTLSGPRRRLRRRRLPARCCRPPRRPPRCRLRRCRRRARLPRRRLSRFLRRRHRHPRRPHFPRRPRRRRLPRGLLLSVWVTAGTPAAAIRGAMLKAASAQCKSAGRPARRPPTARASPTPCPPQTQIIPMGASQPAVAAACVTWGRPLPHSRPGVWAT